MKNISQDITSKLIEFRNDRHLKQEEVAMHLGMTQSAYNQIESGKTKINVDHLIKLSEFYEINIREFFGEKSLNLTQNNNEQSQSNIQTANYYSDEKEKLIRVYEKRIQELEEKVMRRDKKIEKLRK